MSTIRARTSVWLLLIFLGCAAVSLPVNGQEFNKNERSKYLHGVLKAIRSSPKQVLANLEKTIDLVENTSCRANDSGLALSCLLDHVGQSCRTGDERQKAKCLLISDIAVVNKLNERQFVSKSERFNLMKAASEQTYQIDIAQLLMRKYALLATEMILNTNFNCRDSDQACMVKQFDDYCRESADVKSLPWQACVSAIIWYVGMNK